MTTHLDIQQVGANPTGLRALRGDRPGDPLRVLFCPLYASSLDPAVLLRCHAWACANASLFATMFAVEARSTRWPSFEMPEPYMMSNSTSLNGGATLFLTTLTRVRLPTTTSPFLIAPMRRMSSRCEA